MIVGKSIISKLSLILLLLSIEYSKCFERKLDYAFNENCKEICKNSNVRFGHVRAIGPNDTLHYLWDFTENPTILIAVTSHNAKLQINWKNYIARMPHSVHFSEKPIYSFGVVIERLLEFNDINNNSRIDEVKNHDINEWKLKNFQWNHKNMIKNDSIIELYIEANNYKDSETNNTKHGKLKFLMHGFGSLNHSHIVPCMLHSQNSTQVDITIDHLETKKEYFHSRFAMEILIISENYPNTTLEFDIKRKLDDEFTPGIFEIMELSTPIVNDKSAYLQWRPVSYINPYRDITDSISIIYYHVKNASFDYYFAKNNLLYIYYGETLLDNLLQRMNISFGGKGESFYKDSKFSTWTFIAGYGKPPNERFSSIVIMVISIGVGLPLLILMIMGIHICIRRRPKLNDNEFTHR